jgi:hypothetical protein
MPKRSRKSGIRFGTVFARNSVQINMTASFVRSPRGLQATGMCVWNMFRDGRSADNAGGRRTQQVRAIFGNASALNYVGRRLVSCRVHSECCRHHAAAPPSVEKFSFSTARRAWTRQRLPRRVITNTPARYLPGPNLSIFGASDELCMPYLRCIERFPRRERRREDRSWSRIAPNWLRSLRRNAGRSGMFE